MVQAFLKKWWVESDFKAPNLSLSLRFKGSGCHYNSIYNNTSYDATYRYIHYFYVIMPCMEVVVYCEHQERESVRPSYFLVTRTFFLSQIINNGFKWLHKSRRCTAMFWNSKFIVWITSWTQKGSYAMYDIFVYPLT